MCRSCRKNSKNLFTISLDRERPQSGGEANMRVVESLGIRQQSCFIPPANEPYQTQAQKGDVIGLGAIAENMHLQQGIVENVSRF